jgi:hypothetical protein
MKSIFSVSQPRAGHHVMEMIMRAALGSAFRYCEFYTEPNCCQAVPCARIAEFAGAGYALFMQKSHDHQLADPIMRSSDLILVQIREPTLRAMSNYELDLESHKRQHSLPYMQLWLANEAVYVIDFWRKWLEPTLERRLILRYEDFLAEPSKSFKAVLSALGYDLDENALEKAISQLNVSSKDRSTPFKAREFGKSPYFVQSYLAEFMNLLHSEIGYMGYPTWQEPAESSGPVTALYRIRRTLAAGDFAGALAQLERHVARNDVTRDVEVMLARAMLEVGRGEEAHSVLNRLMRDEKDYFDPYALLAQRAYKAGETEVARTFVRDGVAKTDQLQRARELLQRNGYDPEFLAELPEVERASVTADAVTAGFRWILGRLPESDAVIEHHTRCLDDTDLRNTLLRSQEFGSFYEQFRAGAAAAPHANEQPPTLEDAISALYWLLGRKPHSHSEIQSLQDSPSPEALRMKLLTGDDFRQLYEVTTGRH